MPIAQQYGHGRLLPLYTPLSCPHERCEKGRAGLADRKIEVTRMLFCDQLLGSLQK